MAESKFLPRELANFMQILPLLRFPIAWNHVIDKEPLKFKELEHVLIEKVEQLFRDMLYRETGPD